MWKLMIFGVLVQIVLLVSILDVDVSDEEEERRRYTEQKPCLPNLMVISIEGLQYDDILLALNESAAVRDLVKLSATYFVNIRSHNNGSHGTEYGSDGNGTVVDEEGSGGNVTVDDEYGSGGNDTVIDEHGSGNNDSVFDEYVSDVNGTIVNESGSVFDGKQLLYVGPPATPYVFNTSLWDFILIDPEKNTTNKHVNESSENDTRLLDDQLASKRLSYGSYMLNRRIVIDHMRRIIESQQLDFYPLKLINIGRASTSEEVMPETERAWYFTKIHEVIEKTPRSSSYIFAIISSLSMVVRNATEDHDNDTLLIYGNPDCTVKERTPFFTENITYEEAFMKLEGYGILTSLKREVPRESDVNILIAKGNILEFIGGRAFEVQKMYMNFGLYFTGWETLHAVFSSLEFIEIEISPLVLASTGFIFLMWIGFLSIKATKMAVDSSQIIDEVPSTLLKLLNVVCLVLVVVLCIAARCCGCPCRYLIYVSIAILVFRLFCGELISSVAIQFECSTMDKVKIGLQLCILVSIVECLFWSILYPKILFIVFILAGFGRVLQGALSVMRYRTIIAFSLAMLFIGLQFLWSFAHLGKLFNLNVSASIWAVGCIAAIKFLMEKSNHDRFVMFICVVELLMALSFANVFLIYGFSFFSVVPVVGFFMAVSLIIPLFGGADPKNRLLELAASTSAAFVFFSCSGESFFLLWSFIACFCSYMMDRATTKKIEEDDAYYINIFPAMFHTVLLIMACHIVTPQGGEAIMRAYTLLNIDSQYQVVASGIFFFMKLGFMVNLLEATFLSSGKKLLAVPNLFIVVIILNLVSFRAFIQYSMFLCEGGRRAVFVNHILMHVVAAMSFYLYSFVQVLCNVDFFNICKSTKTTYIPQEAVH